MRCCIKSLPTFTLETLLASRQWSAEQAKSAAAARQKPVQNVQRAADADNKQEKTDSV